MNALLTDSIPLVGHSNLDRSLEISDTSAVDRSMSSRRTCLCCSGILLRHMRLGGLYWRCHSCYTDMPV